MKLNILFNDVTLKRNLTELDIEEVYNIDADKITDSICRRTFTKELIIEAIKESSFTIFAVNKSIVGIMCITIVNNMVICGKLVIYVVMKM